MAKKQNSTTKNWLYSVCHERAGSAQKSPSCPSQLGAAQQLTSPPNNQWICLNPAF
ncbi:hypothetical protein M0L20_02650 [Spirosoma sp. RP8]|uniref:Uncharacterized protein n=1 Tax=Spirosoma liriopis TaxID=2937440 RepID=A0ABT0HGC1_9BACT|nr:hypothetical protein [Spirosoma liriopis]MCK8490733.1 hypothetical protein [Spirosoma liriopis]